MDLHDVEKVHNLFSWMVVFIIIWEQLQIHIAELFRENDDVDFECTGDSGGGTLDDNYGENYPTLGQGVSQDNSDNDNDDDNNDPVDNNEKEDDEKHNEDGEYDNDYHDNNELQNNSFDGTGVCFASSCKADLSHGCFNSTNKNCVRIQLTKLCSTT